MSKDKIDSNFDLPLAQRLLVSKWLRNYKRWRFLALFLLLFFISYFFYSTFLTKKVNNDHLVKLSIQGEIADMQQVRRASSLLDDPHVKGILLFVNSPGGLPTVSEFWHRLLERFKIKKIPVVVIVEDVCASGCYLSIVGANRIFSYASSMVGSIGAVSIVPNYYEIIKKWDLRFDVIKSAPLKAEPNPYSEPKPLYEQEVQRLIGTIGSWFQNLVIQQRSLSKEDRIRAVLSQGGVYLAQEALDLHLIDEIGDEIVALDFLRKEAASVDMPLVEFDLENNSWLEKILNFQIISTYFSQIARVKLL